MATQEISERAGILLKTLVERHIRDGQPVGSRTLLEEAGLPVSAATIRNVMSDLEERGYLLSPHTSAGRIPTAQGYRLFVDSLLQVRPLEDEAISVLRAELHPDKSATQLVQSASSLLSSITDQAGLVTVPRQETNQLRQVEFLPLSGDRVLVILVVNEREVQNRIIHTQRPFTEQQLREAARMVNKRFAGRPLYQVQEQILREMQDARSQIDNYLQAALDLASKALDQEESEDEYVVAGESRLLDNATAEEMLKLRELFDAFEQKKDLLHLLERCTRAQGIQVFIGEEAGYKVLGDYSVITAPYHDGARTLGVLGVIGPTRMAYERVIPIVDVTARMLSLARSSYLVRTANQKPGLYPLESADHDPISPCEY
jgi:heat-inducible transcriptional repressor